MARVHLVGMVLVAAFGPACDMFGPLGDADPVGRSDSDHDAEVFSSGDSDADIDEGSDADIPADSWSDGDTGTDGDDFVDVAADGDGPPDAEMDGEACESLGLLRISPDARYLVDRCGDPVYLLGGTAWTLPENGTREDVDFYIEDRQAKGFSYVQVVAARDLDDEPLFAELTTRTMNPTNMYGHQPFETAENGKADPSRPITAEGGTPQAPNDYWDHLEYVINRATEAGMYVGVLPTWGKYYVNVAGSELRIFSESSARSYGRFLGQRYRAYSNIIWILGGDIPADAYVDGRPIYRAMAEGLVEGSTGSAPSFDEEHAAWSDILITYHGRSAAAEYFNNDPWLTLNMLYRDDPDILDNAETYYNNTPTRPMLEGESWYEGWVWDGSYKDAAVIRRQMYHVFFGGALAGYVYGVANSTASSQDQVLRFQPGWRDRLNLEGADDLRHLRALLDEHPWWLWVPDQSLVTSGRGEGASLKAAARSSDGGEILVYFADATRATVDATAITTHPRARVTWLDPRNGDNIDGGVFEITDGLALVPPGGLEDAVAILQGTNDPADIPTPDPLLTTINGEVVLAAEDYYTLGGTGGDLGTWSPANSEANYLGEGYMRSSLDQSDDGSHLQFSADNASLSYTIDFRQTGRYYVHLRALAMDNTENGFFATIDGQQVDYGGQNPEHPELSASYIYVEKLRHWNWYTDGGGAETRGLRVSFEINRAGSHTFTIYRRDTGSRLDHIWLTQDPVPPQRVWSLDLPDPSEFVLAQ